jgi:hypothetical protein
MNADAPVHMLVYAFESGSRFQGELLGALERLEAGGALRVLEALFVQREGEGGELTAFHLRAGGAGLTAPLLTFRLDPAARSKASEAVLAGDTGMPGAELRELGEALEPGAAFAAVLVEYSWATVVADAVRRTGGREVASELVGSRTLAAHVADLRSVAGDSAR